MYAEVFETWPEGGIALEQVPGEVEKAEGEYAASAEHDGHITVDGVAS